jgi:hypothetical protein
MEGTLSRRRGLRRAITPAHSIKGRLTSTLESLNILGSLGEFGDGLDEGDSRLLVGLEGGKDGS